MSPELFIFAVNHALRPERLLYRNELGVAREKSIGGGTILVVANVRMMRPWRVDVDPDHAAILA